MFRPRPLGDSRIPLQNSDTPPPAAWAAALNGNSSFLVVEGQTKGPTILMYKKLSIYMLYVYFVYVLFSLCMYKYVCVYINVCLYMHFIYDMYICLKIYNVSVRFICGKQA